MSSSAIQSWKHIDFPKLLADLSSAVTDINNSKETVSLSQIKELADTTKSFQQLSNEDKLEQLSALLKGYQDCVSSLYKRSKASEKVIKSLAGRLSLAPDPVPIFEAISSQFADSEQASTDTSLVNELTVKLVNLQREYEDFQQKYEDAVLLLMTRSNTVTEDNDSATELISTRSELADLQSKLQDSLLKYSDISEEYGKQRHLVTEHTQTIDALSSKITKLTNQISILESRPSEEELSSLRVRYTTIVEDNRKMAEEVCSLKKQLTNLTKCLHTNLDTPTTVSSNEPSLDALAVIKRQRDRYAHRVRCLEEVLDKTNSKIAQLEAEVLKYKSLGSQGLALSMLEAHNNTKHVVENPNPSSFKQVIPLIDGALVKLTRSLSKDIQRRRLVSIYLLMLHFLFFILLFAKGY
ncbi:hypothetical protein RCL1_006852 [Eukaryota sp. TZLM3-RCL]